MSEVIYPISFFNEVVLLIPSENQYVCIWESDNPAVCEDCDSCIGYDQLDMNFTPIDGGECDYNSEDYGESIHDKIPMMMDFIFHKLDKEYEIVSHSIDDFEEKMTMQF